MSLNVKIAEKSLTNSFQFQHKVIHHVLSAVRSKWKRNFLSVPDSAADHVVEAVDLPERVNKAIQVGLIAFPNVFASYW